MQIGDLRELVESGNDEDLNNNGNPSTPGEKGANPEEKVIVKYREMTSLRISSNELRDISGLFPNLEMVLTNPENLRWLDLSYNHIPRIGASLKNFVNLTSLNLHSNGISKFSEVKNLAQLPKLQNLTLHGNPIEEKVYSEKKYYRNYIIHLLPDLAKLDFSSITKQDRVASQTWATIFRRRLKEGSLKDEERRNNEF